MERRREYKSKSMRSETEKLVGRDSRAQRSDQQAESGTNELVAESACEQRVTLREECRRVQTRCARITTSTTSTALCTQLG